ncbi:hypothetical protein V7S43_004684 [Phytophthora oleae]|uniref:TraD/TraG TraM recognition site domain-containing protein n=1 Tax=Phytophthora oleae TaxID=2107226 RepID=A0ABD3FXA0_9STRA
MVTYKKEKPRAAKKKQPKDTQKTATGKRKRSEQTATVADQTATTTVQETAKRTITFDEANAIVQDQQFWQRCEYVMKLLTPVVKKTKGLETYGCSVSIVYQTLADLLNDLQYCNPDDSVVVQARSLVEDQKFDTMRIAFLLDPTKNLNDFVGDDCKKALNDVPVVTKRLGCSEDMVKSIVREANAFVSFKRGMSSEQKAKVAWLAPMDW